MKNPKRRVVCMSTEEIKTENREDPPPKRQRLKLIDIYTNRGAFSGDELKGIAERVREITLPNPPLQHLPDTGKQSALGEASGELSGGSIDEPSDQSHSGGEIYPIENADSSANNQRIPPSTVSFTPQPDHPPYRSPNDSSHDSPDNSPDNSSYDPSHNLPTIPLTENQAILYFCLKRLNGATTNLTRV